jgi:hypothetical protein
VQELAAYIAEEYGSDAARVWTEARDGDDLRARISALPGFGEMKVKTLAAVLARQYGVSAAQEIAPEHRTLGDVTSPQDLVDYQTAKRAHKAAQRAKAAR